MLLPPPANAGEGQGRSRLPRFAPQFTNAGPKLRGAAIAAPIAGSQVNAMQELLSANPRQIPGLTGYAILAGYNLESLSRSLFKCVSD